MPSPDVASVDDPEEVSEAAVAEIEQRHNRDRAIRFGASVATTVLLIGMGLVAIAVGSADIHPAEVLRAVLGPERTNLGPEAARRALIVTELRFPRVMSAVLAGAALAVSGTIMQGLLRNVLVSPFTVGISSAAAFGASVAIVLGASLTGSGAFAIVSTALVASLGCAGVVFMLSWIRQMRPATVILVGVALAYLFGALTSTLQLIGTDEEVAAVVRWTFGSFNAATMREVWVFGIMLALGLPAIFVQTGSLNAVAFGGDEVARSLGVNVTRIRLTAGIIAVSFAAVVISFTGIIGFVGLVGPHIARLIIGSNHFYLLPFSMLCGALLLLGADTIGRTLFAPRLIPVGIVVSYIGVPLFLNLILSRRREYF